MTNANAFTLGGLILVGLVLHAALSRDSISLPVSPANAATPQALEVQVEMERIRAGNTLAIERVRAQSAKIQALIARGPSTLVVGDRTFIVSTDWKVQDDDAKVTFSFYEYKDGKLVRVVLDEPAAPR